MVYELTPEQDKALSDYYSDKARHDYRMALWGSLTQRGRYTQDWNLGTWGRLFYSAKALICLLLQRQRDLWAKDCVDSIAMWDEAPMAGTENPSWAASWEELVVGHGIFSDWYYDTYNNANC